MKKRYYLAFIFKIYNKKLFLSIFNNIKKRHICKKKLDPKLKQGKIRSKSQKKAIQEEI